MADAIAAPPGWYFCRVVEGDEYLQRYAIAAWRVMSGDSVVPLLAKPGEAGLVPPSAEDRIALVGLCPPDRDYQAFFSTHDVQDAHRRLYRFRHTAEAEATDRATVAEVEMPGVGPVPVRNAAPPGQQPSEWARRAWGLGQPRRLGGSES